MICVLYFCLGFASLLTFLVSEKTFSDDIFAVNDRFSLLLSSSTRRTPWNLEDTSHYSSLGLHDQHSAADYHPSSPFHYIMSQQSKWFEQICILIPVMLYVYFVLECRITLVAVVQLLSWYQLLWNVFFATERDQSRWGILFFSPLALGSVIRSFAHACAPSVSSTPCPAPIRKFVLYE